MLFIILNGVTLVKSKGDVPIDITSVKVPALLRAVDNLPVKHGTEIMHSVIEEVARGTGAGVDIKRILGGVGFGVNSVQAYVIQPVPLLGVTLKNSPTHIGAFIRYDNARQVVAVRGMMYIPTHAVNIAMVFEKLVPKIIVHDSSSVQRTGGFLHDLEFEHVAGVLDSMEY